MSAKHRITIGKENCLNDLPIILKTIKEVAEHLHFSYVMEEPTDKKILDALIKDSERLKRLIDDADDMLNELKDLANE